MFYHLLYRILSQIIFAIIIFPTWLVVALFKPKLFVGFKEKCGFYKTLAQCGKGHCDISKTIIFYGVSVGEVLAMENLIKKSRQNFPEINIILLTGTQTGQEIAQKKLKETCDFISYFPYDFPFCINNMIKKLKPNAIFVMETELWPNFAHVTKENGVPFYIINARISDRTYKSYKRLSFIFGSILKKYTGVFPQSKQDMEKLISIGANPQTTKIMGNLKFDIKCPDISNINFEKNPEDKIILAGSTHAGEEEIILKVFNELKNEIPKLKLIIAPRHPGSKYNFQCGYRSKKDDFENHNIILLDTIGELGKFYSICDVAFIGGSFRGKNGDNRWGKGVGGHNPLEATIFNKPVVSGPSIHNFKDIYALLTLTDCAKVVQTPEELKGTIKKLLTDKEYYQKASKDCEKVLEQNKGALDFVLNVLQELV